MTYFVEDLRTYLINNGLITSGDTIDWYDDSKFTSLICISVYDSNSQDGKYSIQFLAKQATNIDCKNKLYAIYNHFFNYREPKPVYKIINNVKCLFKPITKPAFLKQGENDYFYYVFNLEVWTQKQ